MLQLIAPQPFSCVLGCRVDPPAVAMQYFGDYCVLVSLLLHPHPTHSVVFSHLCCCVFSLPIGMACGGGVSATSKAFAGEQAHLGRRAEDGEVLR